MAVNATRRRRIALWGPVVAALVLTNACSAEGNQPVPPATAQPPKGPATDGVPDQMPAYLAAADRANEEGPTTAIRAAARPTVVQHGATVQTMVIRDEDGSSWPKGNYRLVVYCVGSGTLYAHFSIGDVAKIEEIPPCGTTVTTGAVDVASKSGATKMSVVIVPAGDAKAAVSYQIQRQ